METEVTAQSMRESEMNLRRDYQRLKDLYLCKTCQNEIATTPPGDTICLCTSCSGKQKTVQALRFENSLLRSQLQKYKPIKEQLDKGLLYVEDEVIAKT